MNCPMCDTECTYTEAEPGRKHSYTSNLAYARRYYTREEAEADRCVDNERVLTADQAVTVLGE